MQNKIKRQLGFTAIAVAVFVIWYLLNNILRLDSMESGVQHRRNIGINMVDSNTGFHNKNAAYQRMAVIREGMHGPLCSPAESKLNLPKCSANMLISFLLKCKQLAGIGTWRERNNSNAW